MSQIHIPGAELPVTVAEAFTTVPVSFPAKSKILRDARLGVRDAASPISGSDVAQVVDCLMHARQLWSAPDTNTYAEAFKTGLGRRRLVVRPLVLNSAGSYQLPERRARSLQQKTRDYEIPGGTSSTFWIHVGYADRGVGTPSLIDPESEVLAGSSIVSSISINKDSIIEVVIAEAPGEVGVYLELKAVDDLKFVDPISGAEWELDATKPRFAHKVYLEF